MKKLWILLLLFMVAFSLAPVVHAEGNGTQSGDDGCTIDADCDADEVCMDGVCEDIDDDGLNDANDSNGSDNGSCVVDDDCSDNEVCTDGVCEEAEDDSNGSSGGSDDNECTADADCGEGYFCDSDNECEDIDGKKCVCPAGYTLDGTACNPVCLDRDPPCSLPSIRCKYVGDGSESGRVKPKLLPPVPSPGAVDARERWLKDCVDESAARDMNQITMKLRKAEQEGDIEKARELKEKLKELSLRIREKSKECAERKNANLGSFVSTAVHYKNGSASELVQYYKLKLSEISDETNVDTRIELLRELRAEIDGQIREMMQKRSEIRREEIKDLVQRLEIRRDKIKADDVEIEAKDKTIITEINGKEVKIKISNGRIKIEVEGVEADSEDLTLENDILMLGDHPIKVLPSEVKARYRLKVKEMNLEQEDDQERAVYKIKYEQNKKILGLFKARAEKRADIDAESGDMDNERGPWWEFLSTDDNSAEAEAAE